MGSLQEFAKRFTKSDPAVGYVAFAFLVACIYPVFSLRREDVLDKSFAYGAAVARVAVIIAMTLYNRIAGIIALIVIIAMLNRPVPSGPSLTEGFNGSTGSTGSTGSPPSASEGFSNYNRSHKYSAAAAAIGCRPEDIYR